MATTDIVIGGLYHMQGQIVSVTICGLDCGDYTVTSDSSGHDTAGGFVTVPVGSDPDGLLSGAYIAQFNVGPYDKTSYGDATTQLTVFDGNATATVYVPVVIGFTYPSLGQILRPVTEQQTRTPQGPALGKTRRLHRFAALLNSTQGISFGTDIANVLSANLPDSGGTTLTRNALFSGVFRAEIEDDYSYDGMLCWSITRPYPASIVAVSGFVETEEV